MDSDDATELSRKAILFEDSDINKLVRDHREKINHFSTKALVFFILIELKHNVITDIEIVGVGIGDLFDITTQVLYEFESFGSKRMQKKVNDIYKNV